MKKPLNEMVWPHHNYTDKIHSALGYMFSSTPNLSYTIEQMKAHIVNGFVWLHNNNKNQDALLSKIIKTGIQKLVQSGKVAKVTSNVSVESQWQSVSFIKESGYINITSEDAVAISDSAKEAIGRRAIGKKQLWRLNYDQTRQSI